MKEKARQIQHTIRGVPHEIDAILRRKAARCGQSLNQVILDELAATTGGGKLKADFSDLVARWTPDPAFDEIITSQREIYVKKWK